MDDKTKCYWLAYWRRVALLLLVVAAGAAVVRLAFHERWNRSAAVRHIERHWGWVSYKIEADESSWRAVLRRLIGNGFFCHVTCVRAKAQHECTLDDLVAVPELEQLELSDARLAPNDLAHLRSLYHLWILSLDGTNVRDSDMARIGTLSNLEWLNLAHTSITDEGLMHLHGLKKLRLLFLRGTKVTGNGERLLRAALRNCDVDR